MSQLLRATRVAVGLVLTALVVFPVYALLDSPRTGLAGEDVLKVVTHARSVLLLGAGIVLVLGAIVARIAGASLDEWVVRVGAMLSRPRSWAFATIVATVAGVITLAFSLGVLGARPNLLDAMTQLVHARYLAAGMLTAPTAEWSHFWHVQNSVITAEGWVSQYPPGYPLILAAGLKVGAVWLVGPLLVGVAVFFTSLAADRLLEHDRPVARLGSVMLAASPFFIGLAGAYMNHVAAAALFALALYLAVRAARSERTFWAVGSGAALGALFSVRPMTAIVAAVVVVSVWASQVGFRQLARWLSAAAGGAPLVALVAAYNAKLFGSPVRFGYTYAQGASVGLGFHLDPWGNVYGAREALGYTSSDLTALSLALLETPFPAVLVVGLFLAVARRLSSGERVIAVWALLPVLANAFYWHHGIFMGPRMLSEAAPAWCILVAVSAVGLVRRIPKGLQLGEYSIRGTLVAAFLLSYVAALAYVAPERLIRYRSFMPSARIEPPRTDEASLVFVHGAWTSRVAMKLAAAGMRLDSVETVLRQNSTCKVHHFAEWYVQRDSRESPALSLDFTPGPGKAARVYEISRGNIARHVAGDPLTPACLRQIAADTTGIVDVSPMLWTGDLPALNGDGALYVRDYGPGENRVALARYPTRKPYVFYRALGDDQPPMLVPYDEGMAALWGEPRPAERLAGEADR